ncbi:hypothetical protein C8Q79DRAFT_520899 [Trametes meyenii]|nr:hypothetical protein C8Q79DRAFT_520899 [Trametes meyenii]
MHCLNPTDEKPSLAAHAPHPPITSCQTSVGEGTGTDSMIASHQAVLEDSAYIRLPADGALTANAIVHLSTPYRTTQIPRSSRKNPSAGPTRTHTRTTPSNVNVETKSSTRAAPTDRPRSGARRTAPHSDISLGRANICTTGGRSAGRIPVQNIYTLCNAPTSTVRAHGARAERCREGESKKGGKRIRSTYDGDGRERMACVKR